MQADTAQAPATNRSPAIGADLIAVVVAVNHGEPRVLTIEQAGSLPSGPFELGHRSLQSGLRAWVERQTGFSLGYVEQLYTFADRDRIGPDRVQISISYLGLTLEEPARSSPTHGWQGWYDYFPWEDHRAGLPSILTDVLVPRLLAWADRGEGSNTRAERRWRVALNFGLDDHDWNEELVLQRYELLYEAGLVAEAVREQATCGAQSIPGRPMIADHRRILATGIARLRTKIKYRPVVFELMPRTFTLLQLQRAVEALAGRLVHKQNFRRLIEQQDLVEETGETTSDTGGRPAKRFRFRQSVLEERTVVGTRLPLSRA
ncbi:NUDIX hydrolase [Bosea sp. LjRoot237]|uniref:NUDIX hydrolase n=1 Tax=Bosea sp. LjRoot237 TaxID=3342292 RepID=UPI003ECF2A1E